jgi:hypothetical protein
MAALNMDDFAAFAGVAVDRVVAPRNTGRMGAVDALRITREVLVDHGLHGWGVALDSARKRAGQCNHTTRTISMSTVLLAQRSWEDSYNTIIHEVAHAIVGHGHGHDGVWQRQHQAMGGDGKRCFDHQLDHSDAPWVGECAHGRQFGRYKTPMAGRTYHCKCAAGSSLVEWSRR